MSEHRPEHHRCADPFAPRVRASLLPYRLVGIPSAFIIDFRMESSRAHKRESKYLKPPLPMRSRTAASRPKQLVRQPGGFEGLGMAGTASLDDHPADLKAESLDSSVGRGQCGVGLLESLEDLADRGDRSIESRRRRGPKRSGASAVI